MSTVTMTTHRDDNQTQLVCNHPGYPATTESLPSNTSLQHLLETDKINSNGMQTTEISTTTHSDTQLTYAGYQPLAEYQATLERQAANDSMTLQPGLTNELRALQMEGGFETTSDFLHHLVVSERVKRLQKMPSSASHTCSSDKCPCLSQAPSSPDLVNITACSTYTSATNTNSIMNSNHSQGVDVADTPVIAASQHRPSVAVGGASPKEQPNRNHNVQPSVDEVRYVIKSERMSVGVQVNLCRCRPEDEATGTKNKKPRHKQKMCVMSKVKKKRLCLQQGDKEAMIGSFGKDAHRNGLRERRWTVKSGRVCQPKQQRFPRDTKSSPREKQEYLCEICGATFKWRRSLIPHMWEHRDEVSVHQCPHCSISFPYACRLKRHLIAKHPEQEGGPIRCATCGVEVQSYNTLKNHMRIHTGYKPFKCKFCPKAYKWNTGLEYHERVHTGERPFPCQHCTKAFTNKSDLTRHQTVHTGEKPHVCQKCGKGFTQSHTLKSHCKKHHTASLSTADDGGACTQKPHQSQVHSLPQAMLSSEEAAFMLGSFQDPSSANHCLDQMKFTNNSTLHSLQRQVSSIPNEREIAEVVVNMLAQ